MKKSDFTEKVLSSIYDKLYKTLKSINKNYVSFRDYIVPFPFIYKRTDYPGAYVKNPLKQKDKAVIEKSLIDLDAASLYPSIIYSTNCSPDTLIYLIPEKIASYYIAIKEKIYAYMFLQKKEKYETYETFLASLKKDFDKNAYINFFKIHNSGKKFIRFLTEYIRKHEKITIYDFINDKYIFFSKPAEFISFLYKEIESKRRPITVSGAIFYNVKEKEGVLRILVKIPTKERKKHKKILKELLSQAIVDQVKVLMHDMSQIVFKTIANSLYGFTGYEKSRLFNVIIAATITLTGRQFIKYVGYKIYKTLNYLHLMNKLKYNYTHNDNEAK